MRSPRPGAAGFFWSCGSEAARGDRAKPFRARIRLRASGNPEITGIGLRSHRSQITAAPQSLRFALGTSPETLVNAEATRLEEARHSSKPWRKWGPYLSERQWGTVREDYSDNGDAWNYFTHDQARSRAYRWGEEGLAGISDDRQRLCFALALWNGKDPIIKERLFGLANSESNHGEDVKEYYFYLDSTPTHSYMKYLYKYPQSAYPYEQIVRTSRHRG